MYDASEASYCYQYEPFPKISTDNGWVEDKMVYCLVYCLPVCKGRSVSKELSSTSVRNCFELSNASISANICTT